jgi:hypothetical protein
VIVNNACWRKIVSEGGAAALLFYSHAFDAILSVSTTTLSRYQNEGGAVREAHSVVHGSTLHHLKGVEKVHEVIGIIKG